MGHVHKKDTAKHRFGHLKKCRLSCNRCGQDIPVIPQRATECKDVFPQARCNNICGIDGLGNGAHITSFHRQRCKHTCGLC